MQEGTVAGSVFVVAAGGIKHHGGIGRLVRATVRHWREHDLHPPLRVLDPYGETLSPRTLLYLLRVLLQIAWNAYRRRIVLVHVHMASRGSMIRKSIVTQVATRLGLPVLLHLHGSRLDDVHANLPHRARQWLRQTLGAARRIVVPGTYWRDVVVGTVGIDPSVVRVVANAVAGPADVAPRPPRARCELLFLGQLSPRKGLPELIEALGDPCCSRLSWRLRVAGDGDADPFAVRATGLGIADRIEFLGWIDEERVQQALRDTDVFVLPSHNEGLSVAMLEAMAHGCAIVATPVGSTLDAVTDGESALIVPPRNPARLAAALRRVIEEPELRRNLQITARQRWSEGFQIAHHCRQLVALYHEICPALEHHASTKLVR